MTDRHPGGCECGAFRYVLTGPPIVIYACHCTICQTQSGSAFGMAMRIHEQDFEIVAGELRSFRREAASGQIFTNSFCPLCGTRIHHRASRAAGHLSLKPGTLDDTSWLRPTHHVHTASAQSWVIFSDDACVFETVPEDRGWLNGD